MKFEELNKIVQEILGESLNIKDKGTVTNLNNLPQELIENAKKLDYSSGLDAVESYIEFYLHEKDWKYIRAFVHQVILGKEEAKLWRKGQILYPSVSLKDQLTKTKEEIFGEYIHKIQFIFKPNFPGWTQGVSSLGSFVFPEPDADYTSTTPKGFLRSVMDVLKLAEIDKANIDVLFRRWIALRITSYLDSKNLLINFHYSEALEEITPKNSYTKDAHKAIEGLLKEKELGVWVGDNIPGYCGPDEFYK